LYELDNKINTTLKLIKMKKGIILLMWLITFSQVHATIITVDNNFPSMGDYTTLQAAHDAASSGDTLLLFPSNGVYQGINVNKMIIILGTGFQRNQTGVKNTFLAGEMLFNPGSDGSQLIGVCKFNDADLFHVKIDADNIIIRNCYLTYLTVFQGHINTFIKNNIFIRNGDCYTDDYLIKVENPNLIVIANNIIKSLPFNGCQSQCILASGQNIAGEIINNIIINTEWDFTHPANIAVNAGQSQISVLNNIIGSGMCYGDYFSYNITRLMDLPDPTNINVNDFSSVFIDYPGGNYHLSATSPANGSGQWAADMGIYGGDFPFIDGGYPELPAIYFLYVPHTGSQQGGLPITIKAKSND
jgi:hypothetical protein